jgi:hypothetical protein
MVRLVTQFAGNGHIAEEAGMDNEHRVIAKLLALKDASDEVILDQVRAIGVTATRYMLFDEADRLQHTNQQTALDCIPLIDRIA